MRPLDRQQPALGRGAAPGREAAEPAAGRDHAMARHDDRERVLPERLAHVARRARRARAGPRSRRRSAWRRAGSCGRPRRRAARTAARRPGRARRLPRSAASPRSSARIASIAAAHRPAARPRPHRETAVAAARASRARSPSGSCTPTTPRSLQAMPQAPIAVAKTGEGAFRHGPTPRIRSSIGWVTRQTPCSVRRKRWASSSGSSPITRPGGIFTPRSTTTRLSRACRPISTSGSTTQPVRLAVGMDVDAREQQRVAQGGAGDDAAARDQRAHGLAAPALLVVHELGRRGDLGIGPDRPVAVVQVEGRDDPGEVHVGIEIGVDRAGVAPIILGLVLGLDAGLREPVRHRLAVLRPGRE